MAKGKKLERQTKSDRLKPLSLHPLTTKQALSAFMRVDRKRVQAAERRALRKKGYERA